MKKLFAFLAAALLVVACGGTKEEPKTIEDQALEYMAKIEKAVKAGDFEETMAVTEAYWEWVGSLNEEQQQEVGLLFEEWYDEVFGVDDCDDDCDDDYEW